ncbi:flagellar biosynthesis regulator FlaF [Kitasatospora sp. MAP12-15]|uniref:DUF397 domain-containing protein n=1 Tax=unclassified Kitasatospora TaxID=2633591 RepID=UPI0024739609|nr:DUF397 domain-containing protein [Kitasatospora sp. MAP12-44]MDH6115652.1 flagellar biosynthesis regulator FlaF [Kitasatospora sp. MAP12-44]
MSHYPDAAATGLAFAKSTYSGGNENCLECAADLPDKVAVRDSKDPHGPALRFTRSAWSAFIHDVVSAHSLPDEG